MAKAAPTDEEIAAEIRRWATLSEYTGETKSPLGRAAVAKWRADEDARITGQRWLMTQIAFGPHKAALQKAIADRAWTLLDYGNAEAADALLEFLPEQMAGRLLDEFFDEPDAHAKATG